MPVQVSPPLFLTSLVFEFIKDVKQISLLSEEKAVEALPVVQLVPLVTSRENGRKRINGQGPVSLR